MAFQATEVGYIAQEEINDILPISRVWRDFDQVLARRDDPFGDQEARRQFVVVPGRSHRDADRARVHLDFERLFESEFVFAGLAAAFRPTHDIFRPRHWSFSIRTRAL